MNKCKVIVYGSNDKNYCNDIDRNYFYIACSRAINELEIVCNGSFTRFIGDNYEEIMTSKLTTKQSDTIEQMRQEFYKGAFGGQWMKDNDDNETYDKSRIDKDFAEKAFDLYHRLVEEYQSEDYLRMLWSRDSRVTYGSENVIIAIYDMITQGSYSDSDIMEKMREHNIPLTACESGDPLTEFDMIGFTLQYELSYTNVLNMLDLAGVPLRSRDRKELSPIVVAGGPCVCNPEPIADFVDIFFLGEGEEVDLEVINLYKEHKAKGYDKKAFLRACADIEGVYVPSLYDVTYNEDGTIAAITPS